MRGFDRKVQQQKRWLPRNVAAHVHRSIVTGSEVTAAPGQPVASGALRDSWKLRYRSDGTAESTTDSPYAGIIEDNERGATLRSSVGGFHSVKLTRAGFSAIVEHEGKALMEGGGPGGDIPRDVAGRFAGVSPESLDVAVGTRGEGRL